MQDFLGGCLKGAALRRQGTFPALLPFLFFPGCNVAAMASALAATLERELTLKREASAGMQVPRALTALKPSFGLKPFYF